MKTHTKKVFCGLSSKNVAHITIALQSKPYNKIGRQNEKKVQ